MTSPTIRLDIGSRLRDGRQLHRQEYVEKDKQKLGILRAGNSGIMSDSGNVAGSCHRVAHLRQLGIELDPPSPSSLIMFQVGTANEDIVYKDLLHTAAEDEVVLREEEIPISWMTSNGTQVTGRPDMVICRKEWTADEKHGAQEKIVPVLGLELKSIASVWTTREVLVEGQPKLAHLCQAGHYMWKLGVPFRLIYKQYSIQAMPDFAKKMMPRQGKPGSEYLEYNPKGEPKSVKPFEIIYELEYQSGTLCYRIEGTTNWTQTIVRHEDIERYYEFISQMEKTQNLGPTPVTVGSDGKEKAYSNCGYCVLNNLCNPGRGVKRLGYIEWLAQVRKFVADR